MEMDSGKLFVGGISWDTNEDNLRDYFQKFGEVLEAVIMKDRNTGRARGFGFVVFADPYVAERVVKEKHVIDGRTVEAKKAVPRDDQQNLSRSTGSNQGSPGPARTKKIFVGGLASTVTDSDFKKYFDQFGTITDVVVMYDHNTKRPRGFGFITYDSEDAVDRVLLNTFHELNGKMVEVKRAVPREVSPGLTRSPLSGYNHGLTRVNNYLSPFPQGYNAGLIGDSGVGLEGRFSPVTVGRNGYVQYNAGYPIGPSIDSVLNSEYTGNRSLSPNIGYGSGLNPLQGAYSNRYSSPVGYGVGMARSGSFRESTGPNTWVNGNLNYDPKPSTPNDFIGSENRTVETLSAFGSIGALWDSSPGLGRAGGTGSYSSNNVSYGSGEDNFMLGESYGKINRSNIGGSLSYAVGNDRPFGDLYASGSVYDDPTWKSSSTELVNSGNIGYRLGSITSNGTPNNSAGYMDGYNVSGRTNRGIAA